MSLPGMNSTYRSAMSNADVVHIEWTYTDGSGAVLYDAANSDADTLARKGVTTPVADGTSGITLIRFPPCTKARVMNAFIEPATPGTAANHRGAIPSAIVASAGTLSLRLLAANGGAMSDPESGSRGRITIALEYA